MASGGDPPDLASLLRRHRLLPTTQDYQRSQDALEILSSTLLGADCRTLRYGSLTAFSSARLDRPVHLIPIGQYALQIWSPADPIACALVSSATPATFFVIARRVLRKKGHGKIIVGRESATDKYMFRLAILDLSFRIQYHRIPFTPTVAANASPDPDSSAAREAFIALSPQAKALVQDPLLELLQSEFARASAYIAKGWLRAHGFYSRAFGFLGDYALLRMVQVALTSMPEPDTPRAFLDRLFAFDLTELSAYRGPSAIISSPQVAPSLASTIERDMRSSRDAMSQAALLSDFLEPQTQRFLRRYPRYITVELSFWGPSMVKGGRFIRSVEVVVGHRSIQLALRYPQLRSQAWPERFAAAQALEQASAHEQPAEQDRAGAEQNGIYQGYYLIGLASPETSLVRDEQLQDFLTGIGREIEAHGQYDTRTSFIQVTVVPALEIDYLEPDMRIWPYIPAEVTRAQRIEDDRLDEQEDQQAEIEVANDSETRPHQDQTVPVRKDPLESTPNAKSKTRKQSPRSGNVSGSSSIPAAAQSDSSTAQTAHNDDASLVSDRSTRYLRPALDILHRIRHDPALDSGDYSVGYWDRHAGIREMPVDDWENADASADEFIPQSRIRYFRRQSDGRVIWNREARIDMVFGSGRGAGAGAEAD